jgi:hypothetical protein
VADRDLIAEGRRLLATATPGEWWPTAFGDIFAGEGVDGNATVADGVMNSPDRQLIIHMHNTYGELLDLVEELRKTVEGHEDSVRWVTRQRDEARARITELEIDKTVGWMLGHSFELDGHRNYLVVAETYHTSREAAVDDLAELAAQKDIRAAIRLPGIELRHELLRIVSEVQA